MANMQIPGITTLSGTLPPNTSDSETPMFSGVLITNDATTLSGTIKNNNSTMLSGTLMDTDNSMLIGELANDTENPETLTGTVMDDDNKKLIGTLMTNLIRGYSAYEIAVQHGFDGTVEEWLASLVGKSVAITVVEDTDSSYIIEFSVGDESVRTPNLRSNIDQIERQIANMQTDISALTTEDINNKVRITALEDDNTDIKSHISDIETDVEDLYEQVDEIEDSLPNLIAQHNQSAEAHTDIRMLLANLNTRFNTYIDSTDTNLDQLSEIVNYIKSMSSFEIVDNLPAPQNADPKKIYILRSVENEEVDDNG